MSDLVPCFYTGQDFRWQKPAEFRLRAELHRIKKLKAGRFDWDGKIFVFYKRIETVAQGLFNGPMSAKNILAFLKTRTDGEKLHYETPMAGDRGIFARHHRKFIHVSSRNLFSRQAIPA